MVEFARDGKSVLALSTLGRETQAAAIGADEGFDGGAIPIGAQEVVAADALADALGVTCRPSTETLADMAEALVQDT